MQEEGRSALILGVAGQDGSYLAEFLLSRGYRVFGLIRRSRVGLPEPIAHLGRSITLLRGDLLDQRSLVEAIETASPDEIYNFAGTSFVPKSWEQPVETADSTALGVVRLLESIRFVRPEARFYQATSSEVFGDPAYAPQDERTPLLPRNPYGASKVFAHLMVERYREKYGLFAVSGILYNHESPRRGLAFVTRKIAHACAGIALGQAPELRLGDISARRDWGFAGEYVHAMWLMLQRDEPSSYVVATGETHSVQDVLEVAFGRVGLDWRKHVVIDPALLRPMDDKVLLVGDPSRAIEELGWRPTVSFEQLIELMVDADVARLANKHVPAMDWPATRSRTASATIS